MAALFCVVVGATLYLHWTFSSAVSGYRRQMNAAAYDAQLFFDQRESLLRSILASAVRNTDKAPISETPSYFGNTRQIEVLPLPEEPGQYDWALVLTPRDLLNVGLANATMVHTSLRRNATMRIDSHGTRAAPGMSPRIQEWLTQTLLRHTDIPPRQDGHPPIIWLHPPMDTAQRLFLYTPLDIGDPQSGWIGLEVAGVDAAVNPRISAAARTRCSTSATVP